MPFGQEHHKTHLAEHFRLDIRRQTVIHREPEARIARAQELHDSRDRSHVRAQENTRISRPEGCEGRRQNRHGRRRRSGNAHEAGTAQAKIAGLPANALKARGEALGIRKKLKSLRRGAQAPLHALEQREAQFVLGVQQDLAQRGLRNVEHARSGSHGSRAHNGDENLELTRAHDQSIGQTYGNGKHRSLTRANPTDKIATIEFSSEKGCLREWRMDAIVLGGGLMGTATAYFLARRGVRVTLIEKNRIGTGATLASFGNIRRSGRHLTQLPLAHRSRRLWGELQGMLGRDVEFRATGHLRLIFDEDGLADMRAYAEAARPWGLELEELGPNEVRARFPASDRRPSLPPSRRRTAAAIRA